MELNRLKIFLLDLLRSYGYFRLFYSQKSLFVARLCLLLVLISCDLPEQTTESKDNTDLGYAIAFKANECGNYPNYPLYIASGSAKPAKRDMQACILTIIMQKCPFEHYPYYCVKIFKNFEYDIDFEFKNPLDEKKD